MGLDMYLSARVSTSEYFSKDINLELRPIADKCLPPAAQDYDSIEIERQVCYWRKANAIHGWFVENVQGGNDDCGTYNVEIEQLRELRDLCQKVVDGSVLVKGQIENGWRIENGKKTSIMQDGEYITNVDIAETTLPTRSGFFFGGTQYDQYYLDDLKDTITQLDRIFTWCDERNAEVGRGAWPIEFQYHSSW